MLISRVSLQGQTTCSEEKMQLRSEEAFSSHPILQVPKYFRHPFHLCAPLEGLVSCRAPSYISSRNLEATTFGIKRSDMICAQDSITADESLSH